MSSDNPDINAILNRLFDELNQHIDQSIQSQVQEHVTRAIEAYTERIEQLEAANQELQTRLNNLSTQIDTLRKSTPTHNAPPQYISDYSDPIMNKIDTYRNTKLAKDTDKNNAKTLLDYINDLIVNKSDLQKHAYYLICIFCIRKIDELPNERKFRTISDEFSIASIDNPSHHNPLRSEIKKLCNDLKGHSRIPTRYQTTLTALYTCIVKRG